MEKLEEQRLAEEQEEEKEAQKSRLQEFMSFLRTEVHVFGRIPNFPNTQILNQILNVSGHRPPKRPGSKAVASELLFVACSARSHAVSCASIFM